MPQAISGQAYEVAERFRRKLDEAGNSGDAEASIVFSLRGQSEDMFRMIAIIANAID